VTTGCTPCSWGWSASLSPPEALAGPFVARDDRLHTLFLGMVHGAVAGRAALERRADAVAGGCDEI
jgi:hypothetical protein